MGNDTFAAGSVQVHKKVLVEVVYEALKKVDGVVLQRSCLLSNLLGLFGVKGASGIHVNVDQDQEISVDVRIYIRYGFNIPGMAIRVQSVIREAIEKAVDIKCEKINVTIPGIEGEKA